MAKGGYRDMEYKASGHGSMKYNHGKACGMPGEGSTAKAGKGVVLTRARSFEGGTRHKGKKSGGKKMGMAY